MRLWRLIASRIHAYVSLTKPTIMLLVAITGATGLVAEASLLDQPLRFAMALLLLTFAGGSANAFNQAFEKERDAQMERTKRRRPLPAKIINTWEAFIVASLLGLGSVIFLWIWFNPLTAILAGSTIIFYAFFYTLLLKPWTPQNIVIGGAAGAMAPVIGWAAGAGNISVESILMFLIIFFWTPPHFWALALCLKEDYRRVNLPMMPLIVGDAKTWSLIVIYSVLTLAVSAGLIFFGNGILYTAAVIGLGVMFMRKVLIARANSSVKTARGVFGYSIVYLLALFTALIIDSGLRL